MSQHSRNNSFTTPNRSVFRRYSLANSTPTTPSAKQTNSYYNTQTSTKIDCKSPGYSSRVVQYSEHKEKSPQTNRGKYDKLGVFPIVHFFKKDLPQLKRKGDEGSSPANSSNLTKFNSPEHNWMLLEKIIKSNPGNQCSPQKSEENPKSVLDALKEISRKRIHSSGEEFILKEDGKRTIADYDNESSSRKRMKQNSIENSTSVLSPSRYGSVDELMASQSSMEEYLSNKPKRGKFTEKTNSQLKVTTVPVKYVDVETQTIPQATPTPKPADAEKPSNENVDLNNTQRETKKKTSPVKIFDETPLEAMRKNRLTVLMGSLSNKTPTKTDEAQKSADPLPPSKPLVSILSGPTKSPQKSDKHVTFDIPETVNSSITSTSTDIVNSPVAAKPGDGPHVVTKTSAAMVMPIVSASISEPRQPTLLEVAKEAPPATQNNPLVVATQSQPKAPSLQFSMPSPFTVATTTVSQFATNLGAKLVERSVASSSVQPPKPLQNPMNLPTTTQSSGVNPSAGFKFELKEAQPKTETKTVSSPFSFMTSASPTPRSPSFSTTKASTTSLPSGGFVMSTNANQATTTFSTSFSKPTNVPSFSSNFTAMSSTAAPNAFLPNTPKNSFSNFATNSTPSFAISTASKTPTFTFSSNSTPTTTAGLSFAPSSTNPVSSAKSLAFPTALVPPNQNSTPSSAFDKPSGFVPSGSSLTNSLKPTTTSFSFGPTSTTSFNKTSAFDAGFGSDVAKSATKVPFGTTTSSFGANVTTTSSFTMNSNTPSTNVFGNTANNVFGNSSGFNTQTPSFGTTTSTAATNSFGQSQNPGFGAQANNETKTNPSMSFGTPFNTPFGVSTNTSGFGPNVSTFSTASTTFTTSSSFTPSNAFASTFPTTSPFDKRSGATQAASTEVQPFGASSSIFGSNNFAANPQPSQSSVFTFGNNAASNKPAIFSFQANDPPKPSFGFQADKSNAFNAGGQNFGTAPPTFNAMSGPFNVQPSPTTMFSIGTGGSSTMNRSRTQHKAKRRT